MSQNEIPTPFQLEDVLRLGSSGHDVRVWQHIVGGPETGVFDAPTEHLTKAWQHARGLVADGVVGPKTFARYRAEASRIPDESYPFIQAANCGPVRTGALDYIIIHTMEAPEKPKTARKVAEWFGGPSAPKASAHFCVDDKEAIQCVRENVVAWAAPGANGRGIHIEHAGFAAQTGAQWGDEYSKAVLILSAHVAAGVCRRYNIPVARLSVSDLLGLKARGFAGHIDVTNAFNNGKGHTDPGPNFPWDMYLALVRSFLVPS